MCLNVVKTDNEGVLVLSRIKHMRTFQNKKVVHLFTHNSANFLYPVNNEHAIKNLILIRNT